MSPIKISSDKIHDFNQATLALDKELDDKFMIDLLLMPEELRQNSILAAQWHTMGDKQVCPLCAFLDGNIFPVGSGEWGRIFPPIHIQCFLSSKILIYTLNGWKKIGDIVVGDQVLTHRGRFRRVSRLFRSRKYRGKVVTVTMDGSYKRFVVTPEHPFLTEDGWKKASELSSRNKILSLSNKYLPDNYEFIPMKIKSVRSRLVSPARMLFNFAVEEDESYIAGGLVSHNCRCMLSYITSRERGVETRIKEYRPIDPELLKKWSSKVFTDVEIREIAKHHKEFIPEEELEI